MKKIKFLLVSLIILNNSISFSQDNISNHQTKTEAVLILCSPDLYSLAKQWSEGYNQNNPQLQVTLKTYEPGETLSQVNTDEFDYIMSESFILPENSHGALLTSLGRDIIVPIINLNNPFIDVINKNGISKELLTNIATANITKWNMIAGVEEKDYAINFYWTQEEPVKTLVTKYLNVDANLIRGNHLQTGTELVTKLQNDPLAIGFCNLTEIITTEKHLADNICLLPLDRNNNGKLDYFENIYGNLNDFERGVWIGKFPKSLINNIYYVSNLPYRDKTSNYFLNWLLSDGQKLLSQNGFCTLVQSERLSNLEKIRSYGNLAEMPDSQYSNYKLLIISIVLIVILTIGLSFSYIFIKHKRGTLKNIDKSSRIQHVVFSEGSLNVPNGIYYDKTHTWVFMEKNGIVKFGIDDFIAHITGPLTRIKIKNPGDRIKKNEQILSLIKNGKQLNVYSPISGIIKDINESVITSPSLINSSPLSEGWVYLIEPTNWIREIQFLSMSGNYLEWIKGEFIRLKDFLATTLKFNNVQYSLALQEGGEVVENVLEDMEPEIWEEFQTKFINTSK